MSRRYISFDKNHNGSYDVYYRNHFVGTITNKGILHGINQSCMIYKYTIMSKFWETYYV